MTFVRCGGVLAAGLFLLASPALPAAAAPVKVAVFDLELYDTSLEGELRGVDPQETARLQQLTERLKEAVIERPDLALIDTAVLRERLASPARPRCCRSQPRSLPQEPKSL